MSEMNGYTPNGDFVSGVETVTKRKKAPIIAGVTAGVVALGAGGGAIAYNTSDFVKNQVKLATLSPAEYYTWVHEDTSKEIAKKTSETYKQLADSLAGKSKKNMAADYTLTYKVSDDAKEMLIDEMGIDSSMEDADVIIDVINNVKTIAIGASSSSDGNNTLANVFLNWNDEKLVSFETVSCMDPMQMFYRIPELNEQFIGMDLSEALETEMDSEEMEIYNTIIEKSKNLESLVSAEELKEMMTKYTDIWFKSVEEVELKKKEEVKIGDIKTEYTTLTVEIDGGFLYDVCSNYVKEVSKDKTIKKIVCDRLELVDEDEYEETMDTAVESIKESKDSFKEMDIKGEMITYVDAKGTVRGYKIDMDTDGTEVNGEFIIGKEKDKVCGIASLTVDEEEIFNATLDAIVDKNDAYTGEIEVVVEDDEDNTVALEFDKFKVENKEKYYLSGDVTLVVPDIDPITVKLSSDGKSQKISYDINFDGTDFGTIELEYSVNDAKKLDIPDTDDAFMIDVNDTPDLSEYITEEKLSEFVVDVLKKIGLSEEYCDLIADELAGSLNDLGSYDDYEYDDDYNWDDEYDYDYDWDDEDFDSDYDWDDEDFDWSDEDYDFEYDFDTEDFEFSEDFDFSDSELTFE